ncbi:MAG: hypothetical protein ABI442_14380 [Gemmatimonadaceae bacterium]
MGTSTRLTRSLKHEYELFVEQEIENYKESVPRGVLLGIGDEAVSQLFAQPQFALTELVLCEEVDRIIFKRLRLPTYSAWRRRRQKMIDELRKPTHWGLSPNDMLVRTLSPSGEGRVLLAGASDEGSALYLAANGCQVTTLTSEGDALERVMQAAIGAGLAGRVHAQMGDISTFTPDLPLNAVIVNPSVLDGLSADERTRVIEVLQSATLDGGIHLVQTIATAGRASGAVSLEELRSKYRGWTVTVERSDGTSKTFLARKGAA